MYEHLRNELALELSKNFTIAEVDMICTALDGAIRNYEVVEKCTELVVYEDAYNRMIDLYIASKKLEGASDNTVKLYRGRMEMFFDILQKRPEEVSTNDIRSFLVGYQKQRNISDRTLDKYRQIINGFFTWCADEEYITKNPCRNIKEIKYEAKPRKSLTRMELEKLRRACKNKRDLAIIDTLYSTGCRVSELSNMKLSDINSEEKSIHIVGKGKKHNTCYFNTNAQISLSEYIATRNDNSDYLFVCTRSAKQMSIYEIERIVKNIGKRVGLEITPHILRHTCATLSLQAGMELTQVQKMLGHASSDTTLIYAEIAQRDVKNSHMRYVV